MSSSARRPFKRSLSTVIRTAAEGSSTDTVSRRKTRIICTLGPASWSVERICALLDAGMSVARLNFSHGTHARHSETVRNVREAVSRTGKMCAILLDTKGPEIRTGKLDPAVDPEGAARGSVQVSLAMDQTLLVHCLDRTTEAFANFRGTSEAICLDYPGLVDVVSAGSMIRIDDGLINCMVEEVDADAHVIRVRVKNAAQLGEHKGCNLPGTAVDLPALTDKDKEDLRWGVAEGVDFVAASFVRKAADVDAIREVLGDEGEDIRIVSKIENQEGLHNFSEILRASDGIMVARGDLGVEIPIQQVCMQQKAMIRQCNLAAKPVITATQMLDSMVTNPRPTRAEATDVANAVFDGTDCVMLSGETAKGKYPVEAVTIMAQICATAENALDYTAVFESVRSRTSSSVTKDESITSSAVKISLDLNAAMICVLTLSGSSARYVAKYKPAVPVVALCPEEQQARQCLLSRGVFPIVDEVLNETAAVQKMTEVGRANGWIKQGDTIVIVSGVRDGMSVGATALRVADARF